MCVLCIRGGKGTCMLSHHHVSVISCMLYLSPVRSLTKLESVDWRHGDTPTLISKIGTNGRHGGKWSEREREREREKRSG